LPQFSIFGLMVLMFVVSIGFAQLYYWTRAEARWARQEEQRKAAEEAKKDPSTANKSTISSTETSPPPSKPNSDNASDAPIAILMAVAFPMLVMTALSIGYSIRHALRRKRRAQPTRPTQ
jgi:hypothetical protein